MKNTVIFDMDGVVIDSDHVWVNFEQQFFEENGIAFDHNLVKKLCTGKSIYDSCIALNEYFKLGIDPSALAERKFQSVLTEFANLNFCPGFKTFFEKQIVARALKTAIATSCDPRLLAVAAGNMDFKSMFNEHIYCIADVGYASKPAPDVFLHAARLLGADPKECVVIEDSTNGVEAAKKAGMFCVALSWTLGRLDVSKADVVVDSFEQLGTIMDSVLL